MRRLRWILFGGAAVALILASGVVDVRVSIRDSVARAVDALGGPRSGNETPNLASPALWKEGSNPATAPPGGAPGSFADLAQSVSPAVVNIQTQRTLQGRRGSRHPLEEFFGLQPFRGPRAVPSLGTGFVIRKDGYIVTNNHVVEEVDRIEVHFANDEVLEARIIGRDPKTDLALIKVDPTFELTALPFGDSDAIRPGDWVVAIGNPFGLEHTITAGIVSAKHRRINRDDTRRFDDFIQTDAAINPGNSGGPLLNLQGEVVGINSAINPQANTIGFAVPINIAKEILPQLESQGRVSRGYLGVRIRPVDDDFQELLELPGKEGALVDSVEPDSPAARAGIERYDVIVEFDGKEVANMEQLPKIVARTAVGSKVEVVVLREGKRKTFKVELAELDPGDVATTTPPGGEETGSYGLAVQSLTPEIASQLGLDSEAAGVVVSAVEPEGPAARAGLRRGDLIVEVNRHPVDDVAAFRRRIGEKEAGALLVVRRGDSEQLVALKPAS